MKLYVEEKRVQLTERETKAPFFSYSGCDHGWMAGGVIVVEHHLLVDTCGHML
jgi:hypothetical protein